MTVHFKWTILNKVSDLHKATDTYKKGGEQMAMIPIQAARVARGWTQEQLAKEMGVSRETVVAWENGKRDMRPVYFHLFCKVTGFAEDDIILPVKSI